MSHLTQLTVNSHRYLYDKRTNELLSCDGSTVLAEVQPASDSLWDEYTHFVHVETGIRMNSIYHTSIPDDELPITLAGLYDCYES